MVDSVVISDSSGPRGLQRGAVCGFLRGGSWSLRLGNCDVRSAAIRGWRAVRRAVRLQRRGLRAGLFVPLHQFSCPGRGCAKRSAFVSVSEVVRSDCPQLMLSRRRNCARQCARCTPISWGLTSFAGRHQPHHHLFLFPLFVPSVFHVLFFCGFRISRHRWRGCLFVASTINVRIFDQRR